MPSRLLAIADDLTGALEAGARFAASGMPSVVTTGAPCGLPDPVIVVDTETRHRSPDAAQTAVEAVAAAWPSLIYKKTDSTLRGNIGPELRALQRIYGGPVAYVPAYPEMGRTVFGGCLYVHGVPLAETSFARDPLNPVRDGCVRSVVGPECDCVIFDGSTDADIDEAAREILDSGTFRIVAGPAAIAGALAVRLGRPLPIRWPSLARCLVVNGSLHEVSRAQVEAARRAAPHAPWHILDRPVEPGSDPAQVARDTGREVVRLLAGAAFDALLVCGGDTAFGILEALGSPLLRPIGELLPGVPVSRIEGRREILITKAGGFGAPDLLARLKESFA